MTDPMPSSPVPVVVDVVDRFLAAVCAGDPLTASDLYLPDAILDAVVPGWRFSVSGAAAIAAEYDRWFGAPGTVDELRRLPTVDGEVMEYTLQWEENGVPHGARHVHLLSIDRQADRISADHVWCGGRWPADLLAQMGAAASVAGVGVEG
jgi:hypothetical protein